MLYLLNRHFVSEIAVDLYSVAVIHFVVENSEIEMICFAVTHFVVLLN